jgi:hypothetical protein
VAGLLGAAGGEDTAVSAAESAESVFEVAVIAAAFDVGAECVAGFARRGICLGWDCLCSQQHS